MADSLTIERRSWNMSRIRGRNTSPERVVRSMLHRMGFRFSLHRMDLPGKPDIVMPRYGTVIFVHGCFWHLHKNCKQARIPKTRHDWWKEKLEENSSRDQRNRSALRRLGWKVLTVWECETEKPDKLRRRMSQFLIHREFTPSG